MDGSDRSQELIRPFRVKAPPSRSDDLQVRLARTRRFDQGGPLGPQKAPALLAANIRAFFGPLR